MSFQQRRFSYPMERRPRMLKEFLSENSNSCSSNGFKSFPRKPIYPAATSSSMRSLEEMDLKSRNSIPRILTKLPGTRSSKSAFQTLLNAVKTISFTTVKSPSILPRSLSRKLSKRDSNSKEKEKKGGEIEITVKIKDIIRWKSFRYPVEEQHPPIVRCTTMGSTSTTSWSESDFDSGYLSSWDGNFVGEAQNDVGTHKRFSALVGKDSVEATTGMAGYTVEVGPKEVLSCQEEELDSPVSVLQVGENEFSLFDQSLANIQRKKQKFMQTLQRFESFAKSDLPNSENCPSFNESTDSKAGYNNNDHIKYDQDEEQDKVEKRARKLLHCLKATSSVPCHDEADLDQLLLGFFKGELTRKDAGLEREILRTAKDWIEGSFQYDTQNNNKDDCIKDMDKGGRWIKLEEEKEELALEIENAIMQSLIGEILNGLR